MTLSELGIETQCFAPIPNSLFVCRFDLSEIDLATVEACAKNLQQAFTEQDVNASVVFIPSDLVLVCLKSLNALSLFWRCNYDMFGLW